MDTSINPVEIALSEPPKLAEEEKIASPVSPTHQPDTDVDRLLLWLVRYPVSFNHPRPLTNTIEVSTAGECMVAKYNESLPVLVRNH